MAKVVDQKVVISAQDRTKAGFRAADRNVSQFQRSVRSLNTSLVSLAGIIGAGALGREIVQTGIAVERLNAGFKLTEGNAQKAQAALGFVSREAERLGFNALETSQGFLKLSAAARGTAIEGENTKQVFLGILESGRALSLTSEQIEGALRAVEQIMSKGSVQAEELRGQLGERIPGAFQIAARAVGVTTSELNDMLKAGEVLSEDFLPAFGAQLRKEFGDAATDASDDAAAAFARFENALDELSATIAQSGVLDFLSDFATNAAEAIRGAKQFAVDVGLLEGGLSENFLRVSQQLAETTGDLDALNKKIQDIETGGSRRQRGRLGGLRVEAQELRREVESLQKEYNQLQDDRSAQSDASSAVADQQRADQADARSLAERLKAQKEAAQAEKERQAEAKRLREQEIRERERYAEQIKQQAIRERENLLDGLEESRQALLSETDRLREVFEQRAEILTQSVDLELISQETANSRKLALEQQLNDELKEIRQTAAEEEAERLLELEEAELEREQRIHDAKVALFTDEFNVRRDLAEQALQFDKLTGQQRLQFGASVLKQGLGALAQNSKKAFKINQAFGIAEAVISTAKGVTKALEIGFPQGLAAAAVVAASGFAQIQKIRSARPGGGSSGGVAVSGNGNVVNNVGTGATQSVNITVIGPGRSVIEELITGINDAVSDGVELKVA